MAYEPREIEPKWQKIWSETEAHKTPEESPKKPYYCLDMFPYPSGSGLHVGHWRGYVLSDVWARYKKIQGFNVLHPMGWDAFGLPAENDAIKKGIHPRINTASNIENIKRQLGEIGAMYDWDREINTSGPEYYRWTQWIFAKMYQKGLAYRKHMPVNWCPSCKTVLANEEVQGGVCERCGAKAEKRQMRQWMLKITAFAERLLNDLDKLDWPEKVKTMQANWIGRSEGGEIIFTATDPEGRQRDLPVFTTRPDTLFGATYMVLAPEHPLVETLTTGPQRDAVRAYVQKAVQESDVDRTAVTREKTGVFTGSFALNPVNDKKIPIWISDYVLIHYGTGAIMAVPAHDERDFEFAVKFDLPIIEVISPEGKTHDLKEAYIGEGVLINSEQFSGRPNLEAMKEIAEWLGTRGKGRLAVTYKLRDWIFSRQRYWGEPIPIVYCKCCGEAAVPEDKLPVTLPDVESYKPTGTGESPLAAITDWVNTTCPQCGGPAKRETDTMPQWAGSSWYFLRYPDPKCDSGPFTRDRIHKWAPVDLYVGGIEHAVLHLLYARFFTKFVHDLGLIDFDEPFSRLFNQGMIWRLGAKMSKSKGNIVAPDELVEKFGTDSLRMYELFVGPPELDAEWNDSGIVGIHRFLSRFWDYSIAALESRLQPGAIPTEVGTPVETLVGEIKESSPAVNIEVHRLAKLVTERLESFKFNTVISAFMEFVNAVSHEQGGISVGDLRKTFTLLGPLAPHIAEELWLRSGAEGSVFDSSWPQWDEALLGREMIQLPVQINGRLRDTIPVAPGLDQDSTLEAARTSARVQGYIEGKTIKKVIFVPDKILNLIVG